MPSAESIPKEIKKVCSLSICLQGWLMVRVWSMRTPFAQLASKRLRGLGRECNRRISMGNRIKRLRVNSQQNPISHTKLVIGGVWGPWGSSLATINPQAAGELAMARFGLVRTPVSSPSQPSRPAKPMNGRVGQTHQAVARRRSEFR